MFYDAGVKVNTIKTLLFKMLYIFDDGDDIYMMVHHDEEKNSVQEQKNTTHIGLNRNTTNNMTSYTVIEYSTELKQHLKTY